MSDSEPPPGPVIVAIEAERARADAPAEVVARIRQGVEQQIATGAVAAAGGVSGAGAAGGALAPGGWKLPLLTFVLGMGTGAGGLWLSQDAPAPPAQPQMRPRAAPQLPPAPALDDAVRIPRVDAGEPAMRPRHPRPDAAAASTEPATGARPRRPRALRADASRAADRDLQRERRAIARAYSALVRGKAPEALQAVALHAQRFGDGRLREEREAIRVRSHARLGDADRARALGRAFRARYPDSSLWPTIARDLDALP